MTSTQNSTTRRFQIRNTVTLTDLGIYEATDAQGALDAMAQDAGYADHAAACEVAPVREGEIEVTEIPTDFTEAEAEALLDRINAAESTVALADVVDADVYGRFATFNVGTYEEDAGRAREAGFDNLADVLERSESRSWEIDAR
jgi:hypothetical protein